MSEKIQLFLGSWDLWSNAVLAGVLLGAVCGFLGLYVILHRIVFVSAAMAQVSSLGVMLSFFLVGIEALHPFHHSEDVLPILFAGSLTGLFAMAMAGQTQARISDRSRSAESLIGAAYLIATAGLLLIGDRVTQGAHDVSNILFGNAVTVDTPHLWLLAIVGIPVFLAHLWLRKDLLLVSYDPVTAATLRLPVSRLRVFLLLSLGLIISIGTRTIGALPVFAFSVMPAMAALTILPNLGGSFALAAGFGALSAALGYLGSFLFSLPTGACMTATAGGLLLIAHAVARLAKLNR